MMKQKFLIVFVLVICSSFYARPIVLNVNTELENAKFIKIIKVLSYNEKQGLILFENDNDKKIDSAIVRGRVLSQPVTEIDQNNPTTRGKVILSGCLPAIGDKVLVVINDAKQVRLFAYEKDKYYRFWTTKLSNSLTLFTLEPPTLPIYPNDDFYNKGTSCFDGCLYPIDQIELKQ